MRSSNRDSPRIRGRWISLAFGVLILTILVSSGTAFSAIKAKGDPTITNFTPKSGKIGTKVTITGTNFTGASGVSSVAGTPTPVGFVRFGTVTATKWSIKSDTSIVATVPKGAKSGKISVHVPATSSTDVSVEAPSKTGTSKSSFTVT